MKNNLPDYGLPDEMPEPKPGRAGGFKAWFWAVFALLILACAAVWLFSEPEKREEWRGQAADVINDAAQGTPLAGIGNILRDTPPPLPPQIVSPPTEAGTLSGRQVTGTIAAPVDLGIHSVNGAPANPAGNSRQLNPALVMSQAAAPPANPAAPVFSPEPLPPATEDARVRPGYLSDLANWLAARYRPGSNGGSLAINVQSLNHMGGVSIAQKTQGGRPALLRYAFNPDMLNGLYRIYVDRFMADLNAAAKKKGFDVRENRNFHLAIAGRATVMASALEGIMNVPDLGKRLADMDNLARKSVEINAQLANAVFELDELRLQKAAENQISTMQMRVDGLSARYRRAVEDHAAAQRALAAQIRKTSGIGMDEESLLFMAAWVERRMAGGDSAAAAVGACVDILRDLATRCSQTTDVEGE